ncbi:MAG: tetratricopeptide repeat protein [Thermoanaerobaculum sp.]
MTFRTLLMFLPLLWVAAASGVMVRPWVAAVTAGVLGLCAWRRLSRGVRLGPPVPWLAGLALWVLASGLTQPVPRERAAQLAAVALFALVLAVVAAHPYGQRWLACGVVAAGGLAAAWLLAERLTVGGRPGGPFENPNVAATLVVLALAHAWNMGRRLVWAVSPLFLAGVLASASRAAFLAVAALAAFLVFFHSSRKVKLAMVLGLLLAGFGLSWRLLTDPDPLRFERLRIWKAAMATALAYAPWGTGPGGFGDAVLAYNFPREGEFARFHRIPDLAENDLLQLAASLGVPGLVLAGGLVGSLARALRRRRGAAWGPPLVLAVTGLFHSQLLWPVLAFSAVSAGRFSGRFRLKLAPGWAFLLCWPAVVWGALALPWPESGLGPSAEARMAEVRALLGEGTTEGLARALVRASDIARQLPRSAEAWRLLANAQLRLAQATGDATAAETATVTFQKAQGLNPKSVWAHLGEAQAWAVLAQWDRARGAASRALRVEPRCVLCWLVLAQAQLSAGMPEEARVAFEKAQESLRKARGYPFVSSYERALATPDPVLLRRLAQALGVRP